MPPSLDQLETPAVLIDLDIVERNIETMQELCDTLGIVFRPHIKTHKSPFIAQMQLKAGAVGIACQKVSEAEVFAEAGFTDIQLPYNIVGQSKANRLAALAARGVIITVTADSVPVVDGLAAAAQSAGTTINIMVELVGVNNRTGVTTPQDALALAQHIASSDGLHFAGVMVYPSVAKVRPQLVATLSLLEQNGLDVETVSGGGSGAALEVDAMPELTELRVGTYVFYDWRSVTYGWASLDDCAMRVRATVVSANEPHRVVLDSGSKTITTEAVNGVHGHILEYPDAKLHRLNEEHGVVDFSAYDTLPQVGDVLHIVPVHTCVVTNMHDQLYALRDGQIEQVIPVAARGRVW
jgi:D-serine deaminase-like pyridoxal phosphate-dependent protein